MSGSTSANQAQKSKRKLFLGLARPDSQGFSRVVKVAEFVGPYDKLKLGNGGSWCRDDSTLVTIDDFQPLSKAANNAKRQHCKNCRDTNLRFDAKKLGYRVSQVKGNGKYRGSCVGCYWHDPKFFNREVGR